MKLNETVRSVINEKITRMRIYGLVLLLLVLGHFIVLSLWISGYAVSYWWLGLIAASVIVGRVAFKNEVDIR